MESRSHGDAAGRGNASELALLASSKGVQTGPTLLADSASRRGGEKRVKFADFPVTDVAASCDTDAAAIACLETRGSIAIIIDDLHGHLQHEFVSQGFRVITYFSKRLVSTCSAEAFLRGLRQMRPALLWINLSGTPTDSGTNKDRHRFWNMVRVAQEQLLSGAVILSGNARCNSWELSSVQQLCLDQRLRSSLHRWCRMQVKDAMSLLPSPSTTRVLASLAIDSLDTCQCAQHAPSTRTANGRADFDLVCRYLPRLVLSHFGEKKQNRQKQPPPSQPIRRRRG